MLGERLKQCRKLKALTQQNVAQLLNMTTNAYQKYELGTVEPNIGKLIKLADIFGVSVDYLLGRDQESGNFISIFANRLKEVRTAKNVTSKQVADSVGMEETHYQQYERGLIDPSASNIAKLADYFNVSTDYLLGRENYWQDSDGNIKVKVPDDIFNLDTDELKKKLGQD